LAKLAFVLFNMPSTMSPQNSLIHECFLTKMANQIAGLPSNYMFRKAGSMGEKAALI